MNLIEKMTSGTKFSTVEKQIIQYIFENSDDILEMSISELAQATYSSNAAIIRFCRKLDLSGYREFKIKFAQDLEKHRHNKKYIDVNYPFHMLESPAEVVKDIATLTISTINACYKDLNARDLYRISEVIVKSKKIFYYALGDSMIRGMSFENKLQKLGMYLINPCHLGDAIGYTGYATSDDCALFMTYSASSQDFLRYAQTMKMRGTTIITITSRPNSPLGKISDYVIAFPHLEDPIDSIATFYSQIALEYILNVLYSLIYGISYQDNQKKKRFIDQVIRQPE